jgi:hypothetical protein
MPWWHMGSGHIAPYVLDRGDRRRRVINSYPSHCTLQGKSCWFQFGRLGRLQSWFGCSSKEKKFLPLPGISVTMWTELPWLLSFIKSYWCYIHVWKMPWYSVNVPSYECSILLRFSKQNVCTSFLSMHVTYIAHFILNINTWTILGEECKL